MKNIAILIGKHHSSGLPGKNYMHILGRPAVEYPILAAKNSTLIDQVFVSTDSPIIRGVAAKHDCICIDRPPELATTQAPTELVFQHAYQVIRERTGPVDAAFLLLANHVMATPKHYRDAMAILDTDGDLDSVVSVSQFNMFTPIRALRIEQDCVEPLLDFSALTLTNLHDRAAYGDVYFFDLAVQLVRPERCLVRLDGTPPFRWLGRKRGALRNDYGFDIDEPWQVHASADWLVRHGFTAHRTPYKAT